MKQRCLLMTLGLGLLVALPVLGTGDLTYYKDVASVLQDNCVSCHRAAGHNQGGMFAPMSLETYEEVRPWAKSIARAVEARQMPPWFATEHTRGQFHDERVLSDQQVEAVLTWVQSGAPAGDPGDAPPTRSFTEDKTSGWSIGEPDLIVALPEPYFIEDDIEDLNINFMVQLTDQQLPEDTWVQGFEFRVGGPKVHHMCASAYAPGEQPSFGGGGKGFTQNGLGCIALGAEPTFLPEGFAQLLKKGSRISFSMHYNKEAGPDTGFTDQSQLGIYFAKKPPRHKAVYDAIGNTSFEIPPQQKRWRVGAAKTFKEDTYLIALWPHAHLRASATTYELILPDGERELLLDVPAYDQEWQTTYRYKELKRIPAGSRLEVTMWFDNTPERGAERGFNPERAIVFGPETTDEMMLGFLNWAPVAELDDSSKASSNATGSP